MTYQTDEQLRITALEAAIKSSSKSTYHQGMSFPASEDADKIVARAQAYYDFYTASHDKIEGDTPAEGDVKENPEKQEPDSVIFKLPKSVKDAFDKIERLTATPGSTTYNIKNSPGTDVEQLVNDILDLMKKTGKHSR